MRNQEELTKVLRLIDELKEIGYFSVDKERSKGSFKNIFGQSLPDIQLKEKAAQPFYIKKGDEEVFHPRVIEIGKELNTIGGIELMQQVFYEVIGHFGKYGPNLKWAWNGIGYWYE